MASALALALLASVAVVFVALAVPISPSVVVVALLPIAAAIGWRWRARLEKFERALRESEQRFRETLDKAALAAVSINAEGHITYCNEPLLSLVGATRDQVVGHNWFETFVPAEQREALEQRLLQHARSGSLLTQFEGEIITRSGDRRVIAWTNTILRDPDGNPIGTSLVGQDVTDSRRAEAALRKSEALLRLVWDTAVDAMRLTSADGTVVLANPAYCKMVGHPASQLVGKSVADAYAKDRRDDVLRKHAERFSAPKGRSYFETDVVLANGQRRRFEAGTTVLNAAGEPPMLYTVLRDVTDRSYAETALREREEHFRRLFEDSPIGIYRTTPDGQFLLANPALIRMTGCASFEELSKLSIEKDIAMPGYDRAAFQRRIDQEGEVRGLDLNWRRRDGTIVHVRENARAVRRGNGTVIYYEGTLEDITDQKRFEAALRRQEELLRNVITHIPGGVFWKDRRSVYLGCNELVARAAGRRPEEMVGLTDFDFGFAPAEAESYRECDRRVMETGVPVLNLEETQTRSDGKFTLLTSKVPLRDESGAVVGILGVYQDITDRKRLEEQFRQAQKMEAIGRLAGGIAHDFNNLLTVINGFSQVVLDLIGDDSPARSLIDEIAMAGDRAARLTRQLLTFSRQQVVNPRVLNLNSVISGTDRMIARLIGEDIIVSTTLELDLWPVKIDRGQVEQVLMNLVVNSRDAMPTGGRLTICTRNVPQDEGPSDLKPGRYVALSVSDTGVGMDDAVKARVFEPFFTTKGVGKGTGLGLATVYGIVVQNGGHIQLESQPGQGTTFTIYLPYRAESMSIADSVIPTGPRPQGTETILLVEDEPAVRALDRRVLESCGYEVLEAADGLEAVRLVGRHEGPLHLLVSDVVMPHLGGGQLAEQLHAMNPRLKVLFVSGYTNDEVVRHGVGSEYDFLQKPFTPTALAHKVREVLDRE